MDCKRKALKEAGYTSDEPELEVSSEDQPKVVTPSKTPSAKKQRIDDKKEPKELFPKEEETADAPLANGDNEQEGSEEEVSGDTIVGFGRHAERTYRQVMIDQYEYVRWARAQDSVSGGLAQFVQWTNSDEGKSLEIKSQGNEEFTFGQHEGQKFCEIAQQDPTYHVRYMDVLKRKNETPPLSL
jgi:hypothetical protein